MEGGREGGITQDEKGKGSIYKKGEGEDRGRNKTTLSYSDACSIIPLYPDHRCLNIYLEREYLPFAFHRHP